MIPLIAGIVTSLLANNLPKLAQAVVDKGLDYVEEKTGIKVEADEAGNITPEKIAELRLAAMKHEEFKIEAFQKAVDAEHKNTADARAMQVAALNQEDKFMKRFTAYFASGWSLASALYLFCVTFMTIPVANMRLVDTLTGFIMATLMGTIINFFFGSSRGSEMKNDIMKAQNAPK